MASKPKASPLQILKDLRTQARAGRVKGVPGVASIQKGGRFAAPQKSKIKGRLAAGPAAYTQSMIAGQGARMMQEGYGGPYVGPFRFRPNNMGRYARRDED